MTRTLSQIYGERDALRDKLTNLRTQAYALGDRARADGMTGGQLERGSRLRTGIERLQGQVEELEDEARQAIHDGWVDGTFESDGREPADTTRTYEADPATSHVRSAALRAVERTVSDQDVQARLETAIRDIGRDPLGLAARYISAVAKPEYLSAFWNVLAGPADAHLRMTGAELDAFREVAHVQALRAMSESGTGGADGGYAVPIGLDPSLIANYGGTTSALRGVARQVTTSTLEYRFVNTEGVTGTYGYAAEATTNTDNSPSLDQPVAFVEKGQVFIPFSIELGQDWNSAQRELTRLMTDAKAAVEEDKFANGAGHGSDEPEGITSISAFDTGTIDVAALIAMQNDLGPRFQGGARWLMNITTRNAVGQLVAAADTSAAPILDGNGNLLGKPITEVSTLTDGTVIYGNIPAGFAVVDRLGMNVEVVQHLFDTSTGYPTGQRGLYAFWRNTSLVLADKALRKQTAV